MEETIKLSAWLTSELKTRINSHSTNIRFVEDSSDCTWKKVKTVFRTTDHGALSSFFESVFLELEGNISTISKIQVTPEVISDTGAKVRGVIVRVNE